MNSDDREALKEVIEDVIEALKQIAVRCINNVHDR